MKKILILILLISIAIPCYSYSHNLSVAEHNKRFKEDNEDFMHTYYFFSGIGLMLLGLDGMQKNTSYGTVSGIVLFTFGMHRMFLIKW